MNKFNTDFEESEFWFFDPKTKKRVKIDDPRGYGYDLFTSGAVDVFFNKNEIGYFGSEMLEDSPKRYYEKDMFKNLNERIQPVIDDLTKIINYIDNDMSEEARKIADSLHMQDYSSWKDFFNSFVSESRNPVYQFNYYTGKKGEEILPNYHDFCQCENLIN